jgi:2,4-dienoyl-CoA reductase-like NADH-dependent reductase (Old Yellow Enzyme family)
VLCINLLGVSYLCQMLLNVGKVSPLAGKMSTWRESVAHRDVTEAVHDEGGLIAMQILHSGRFVGDCTFAHKHCVCICSLGRTTHKH